MSTDLTPPTAVGDADARPAIRSVVLGATPGAGEDVVGQAFEASGAGTPRAWFNVRRVAPALREQWHITDPDDYVAALHERRTTDAGLFGPVLHRHDLRRIHRQARACVNRRAQRMLGSSKLGVKPPELVYEEAVADPALVRDLSAGIIGTAATGAEPASPDAQPTRPLM